MAFLIETEAHHFGCSTEAAVVKASAASIKNCRGWKNSAKALWKGSGALWGILFFHHYYLWGKKECCQNLHYIYRYHPTGQAAFLTPYWHSWPMCQNHTRVTACGCRLSNMLQTTSAHCRLTNMNEMEIFFSQQICLKVVLYCFTGLPWASVDSSRHHNGRVLEAHDAASDIRRQRHDRGHSWDAASLHRGGGSKLFSSFQQQSRTENSHCVQWRARECCPLLQCW